MIVRWTCPRITAAERRALILILAGDYLPELAEPVNRVQEIETRSKSPTRSVVRFLGEADSRDVSPPPIAWRGISGDERGIVMREAERK